VSQQVFGVVSGAWAIAVYAFVWQHARVWEPPTIVAYAAAFLGVDFCFYWWHRLSHRVNALWAVHSVHHQSDDYNLAVALRQELFGDLTSVWFYLPWAVIGVPPLTLFTGRALNLLYQFWVHTRVIGRLGALDRLVVTPSAHRVHHGCNARYLDKNYGGVLLLWDRLFGTFAAEDEEPVYGTVAQCSTWNPFRANLEPWAKLWREARRMPTVADAIGVWVRPPEWRPGGATAVLPTDAELKARPRYDADGPAGLHAYSLVQYVPVVIGTVLALLLAGGGDVPRQAAVAVATLAPLLTLAGLYERRAWAVPAELVRLMGTVALVAAFAPAVATLPTALGAAGSAAWLLRITRGA
jgi:sterol desaturase/sphingolipid hydroxylase (fatty acid hydroxylase superfamily)